ncbi:peroxiredoxin-like 2C isoform X2 [Lutra lutra]|uniref:peroxiredoxin-like 2C isoform X2 n=1 Tax=Lutra lutra TaxID=9657 RepID=UPI001FD0C452|nr:peroxiredoxin-like 2C isoform X2 [Lutra lutra]
MEVASTASAGGTSGPSRGSRPESAVPLGPGPSRCRPLEASGMRTASLASFIRMENQPSKPSPFSQQTRRPRGVGAAQYLGRPLRLFLPAHFLCYICKEYVEDLAKIPKSFLQPFCKLTGYSHEIYVDPEREIYKKLGMKRGEEIASSGNSPHIKSNILSGSIRSLWRAVTGPLFDFQGDPAQQGGTLILGPGNNIHFIHRDKNRLDHKPINSVLQLVGVRHVDFTSRPSVIHV